MIACVFTQGCGDAASRESAWTEPRILEVGEGWSAGNQNTWRFAAQCWSVHKWNGTLLTRKSEVSWLLLQENGLDWMPASMQSSNSWIAFAEPNDDLGIMSRGTLSQDGQELLLEFQCFESESHASVKIASMSEVVWTRKELFGGSPPNKTPFLQLNSWSLGTGARFGTNIYLPYRVGTERVSISSTGTRQTASGTGLPEEVGIVSSSDGGVTWNRTPLFGLQSWHQAVIATKSQIHLLLGEASSSIKYCSKEHLDSDWSAPVQVVDSLHAGVFLAEASEDTVHLCWLDNRKKRGLGFFAYGTFGGPDVRHNQIYYRNKGDGKASWSKEVLISGNLSWVGEPEMSVEGNRIVVVWENSASNFRSDIYYSVSKDNGRRWTGPARLTDPKGPSAEHPKIALLRGVIHLFYSQNGNLIYRQQPFPAG